MKNINARKNLLKSVFVICLTLPILYTSSMQKVYASLSNYSEVPTTTESILTILDEYLSQEGLYRTDDEKNNIVLEVYDQVKQHNSISKKFLFNTFFCILYPFGKSGASLPIDFLNSKYKLFY